MANKAQQYASSPRSSLLLTPLPPHYNMTHNQAPYLLLLAAVLLSVMFKRWSEMVDRCSSGRPSPLWRTAYATLLFRFGPHSRRPRFTRPGPDSPSKNQAAKRRPRPLAEAILSVETPVLPFIYRHSPLR